ncbi:MAG: hypothetical protein MUC83_02255 [Pirellula sp.]|jgi:hypothetical protein|nr:hypothetical protein [Pirellula sp.]
MNRNLFDKQSGLKPVVRQLCFVVLCFAFYLVSSDRMVGLQAQEKTRRQETVQAESVKPIQRSTAAYKKAANKTAATPAPRVDWTTLPSTYTHSPDGQRVDQFVSVTPEPIFEIPANARSGYRHTRSTLQAGFSSDNYHSVEQWGGPVRPYGEWRYPNRPFAVPYGVWGPQLPQVVGGGFGVFPGALPAGPQPFWPMNGNAVVPGGPVQPALPWMRPPLGAFGFGVGPQNVLTPTQDDYYQQAPMLQGPQFHPLRNGLE